MIKRAGMLLGGLLIAGVPASAQPAPTGDAQIGKQIESSFRHDPYLKNNDIDVRVKNGVATLSGLVDTRSERVRAETLARANGAAQVKDDLRIAATASPTVPE